MKGFGLQVYIDLLFFHVFLFCMFFLHAGVLVKISSGACSHLLGGLEAKLGQYFTALSQVTQKRPEQGLGRRELSEKIIDLRQNHLCAHISEFKLSTSLRGFNFGGLKSLELVTEKERC